MTNVQPNLRPRHWLKRLALFFLILGVGLVALRWWAGRVVDDRLDALVADIQSRGIAILPDDLAFMPVSDDLNAFVHLDRALASFPQIDGQYIDDFEEEDMPSVDDARYVADAAKALASIARARECTQAVWQTKYQNPLLAWKPDLGERRRLARLLQDLAIRQMRLGQHDQAIERVRDMLALSRISEAEPSDIITHLIAISVRAMADGVLEVELTDALETLGDSPKEGFQPVRREQIVAIISEMLNEQKYQTGLVNAWVGERVSYFDTATQLLEGDFSLAGVANVDAFVRARLYVFRPLYVQHLIEEIEFTDQIIQAARTTTSLPELQALLPQMEEDEESPPHRFDPIRLTGLSLSSYTYVATRSTHYRNKARQLLAATALALRLYETDHGRLPDKLTALVPDYLPTLPKDPFDPKGGPIRYMPAGSTPLTVKEFSSRYPDAYLWQGTGGPPANTKQLVPRVIVYSVGSNGVDDGGEHVLDEEGLRPDMRSESEGGDLVFFVRKLAATKKPE